MKKLFAAVVLASLVFAPVAHAKKCDDVESAATEAMKKRNQDVKTIQDTTMPDPEEGRGNLASCLSAVNVLSDPFSMGVKLPSMDQILNSICSAVDSMIQSRINSAFNMVESSLSSQLGGQNPFLVTGNGLDLANQIQKHIK